MPVDIAASNVLPTSIVPLTVSVTGAASPAFSVSLKLTRKPSTSALENGGESIAAFTSSARTLPRAPANPTVSVPIGPAGNKEKKLSIAAATGSSCF